jgi:hypothetical protein
MTGRRQIERRDRPRPGKKPEPVFDPKSIEELTAHSPAIAPTKSAALALRPRAGDQLPAFAQAIAGAIAQAITPARSPAARLTIADASKHTGFSKAC